MLKVRGEKNDHNAVQPDDVLSMSLEVLKNKNKTRDTWLAFFIFSSITTTRHNCPFSCVHNINICSNVYGIKFVEVLSFRVQYEHAAGGSSPL